MRFKFPLAMILVALLLGAMVTGFVGGDRQQPGWRRVQSAEHGYGLYVPPEAEVTLYQPEEILHIVLPEGPQVLTLQVLDNPQRLSSPDWIDATLLDSARRGSDPLASMFPVIERRQATLGGLSAETIVIAGPVELARRTAIADGGRLFLFDHPGGDAAWEKLSQEIIATLELGDFPNAQGFRVAELEASQEIPALPVPYFSQRDPRWACDQIGTCNCYLGYCSWYTGIGDAGCYIADEAMIFDYYTGGFMNPQELDTCLTENGGYGLWQGCGWGVCATTYQPNQDCSPAVIDYQGLSSSRSLLDEDLANGYPVIAWVDGGVHYVVIIGKQNGLYIVHDPLYVRTAIYSGQIIYYVRLHGPPPGSVPTETDLQPGFPVQAIHAPGPLQEDQVLYLAVGDLDSDPELEIFTTALVNGPLYTWNADSSLVPAWPPGGDYGAAFPAAGNLHGPASDLEVVAGYTAGKLVAYSTEGLPQPGWPRESGFGLAPPVLADIDGDGQEEVFINENDGLLHAYRLDGSELPGWPVQGTRSLKINSPAIADLDGNGDLEIIAASEPSGDQVDLLAFHHTGQPVVGFPISFAGLSGTFPVVGDVDGDDLPEIVVIGAADAVHVFGADGSLERTLFTSSPLTGGSAPALADMDGDGYPEILVQAERSLEAWKGDGAPLPGWPEFWGEEYRRGGSSPVAGDVDGDSLPEILITLQSMEEPQEGEVRLYRPDGSLQDHFPKVLPIGQGAIPAIADIDLDGRNEVLVAGVVPDAGVGFADRVWAFDSGGGAHAVAEWGQFGGGPQHRGSYPVPAPAAPPAQPPSGDNPVYLPVISKTDPPPLTGIFGRLREGEAGAASVALTLEVFDGAEWSPSASTFTSWDGWYLFSSPPGLQAGEAYAVRYSDPGGEAGYLARWRSRAIPSYPAGASVGLSEFDLADLALLSPAPGLTVTLPLTFSWEARVGEAQDFYSLVLLDQPNGEPRYHSPPVRGLGSFMLPALPEGIAPGVPYRWTVYIYGPDGAWGEAGEARPVVFGAAH